MSVPSRLRIVTDSTSDLPAHLAAKYGIEVIPCFINIGDQSYLDGLDISRETFYQKLLDSNHHPRISSPGVGVFARVYEKLAAEGVDEILSMHIHNKMSTLPNVARLAAETTNPVRVTVLECGQLSIGLGFLAIAAARMAQGGADLVTVISGIKAMENRTFVYAALDTMTYLKESGRAPGLLFEIAQLLSIKPIIQLHTGVLRLASQVRTASKAIDHLMSFVKELEPLENLAVLHTHTPQRAAQLAESLPAALSRNQEILILEATPILGVHLGPGAVGVACVQQDVS